MPTFLTHSRMSPELARRIERSIARPSRSSPSGRGRVYSRGRGSPAIRMLLMLAVGAVAAFAWLSTHAP
jgi:hypothetical protein